MCIYKGTFSPVNALFEELYNNRNAVNRIPPFVESKIIKTKNYKQMSKQLDMYKLFPGNTIYNSRLLSEAMLSLYKFQLHE